MQAEYHPGDIERLAQQQWEQTKAFRANRDTSKPKYYCLSMFPYPSGKLHMGHVRNYTIGDVLARWHKMRGYNVLQPMGWDAFGLPAENAAIQNKVPPAKWTYDNIAYMKQQLKSLGFAIDWERELATCKPDYYKWNQWLFLRMLEKGIAYKKTQVVNWDPVDQTVLANEQVIDGRGWRTGALVEKREIPGYYLAITKFAEELLADLHKLPGWPDRVKTMQANWIGKSYGVRFAFIVPDGVGTGSLSPAGGRELGERAIADTLSPSPPPVHGRGEQNLLWVYTTRADTIMGVTFVAVAAEHPLAQHAAKNNAKVADFVEKCKHTSVMEADMATMEKEGVDTGLKVTHPLTGEQVPVWVCNYVLMGYGEGAVMAVPAHDERDFHFAKKYADQLHPIKPVVVPANWDVSKIGETMSETGAPRLLNTTPGVDISSPIGYYSNHLDWGEWSDIFEQKGICINSGKYDGKGYQDAVDAIAADLKAKGLGDKQVQWRLRDWGVSRQRYWGCPIPIIQCDGCGSVPVPDDQLPVVLPEDCVPDGSGNPLLKREDFLNVSCPKCGKPAKRETDTMDTFVDSSWYYARYASGFRNDAMVDEETSYWMPVDQYIGGIEHAILHLLYSRFWSKVMHELGLVNYDEPFANLLTQGMVLNHIFSRRSAKGSIEYFAPEEVKLNKDAHGKELGYTLLKDGQPVDFQGMGTMSKSKLNGVDPQAIIDQYGADTARFFMMFASPPEQTLDWSDSGIEGSYRFLRRVWNYAFRTESDNKIGFEFHTNPLAEHKWKTGSETYRKARRELHLLLKQANYDLGKMQFNTVASATMKILNLLESTVTETNLASDPTFFDSLLMFRAEGLSILLRLLSPIAPHISHTLWKELGYGEDILTAPWPEPLEAALVQDEIEIVLQVNGKLRGNLTVAKTASNDTLERLALAHPSIQKHLAGGAAKKIVVVPGRLINIVV